MTVENTAGADAGAAVTDKVVVDAKAPPSGGVSDSGGADKGAPPAGDPPKGASGFDWPSWRDEFAAKNEKIAPYLKRFQSLESVVTSAFDANNKIRSGQYKAELPENAAPEELAEYRKSRGIPETPDKYDISLPEGMKFDEKQVEAVKAMAEGFKPTFHRLNLPPKQANELVADFLQKEMEIVAAQREIAQQLTVERKAEIRAEMGRDYDRNVRLMAASIDQHIGQERRTALMDTVLADGTRLGDHPDFVRLQAAQAMATAPDDALATAEFGQSGTTIEEQYKAALELKFTDPVAYAKQPHQDKLMKLARAKERAASKAA